MILGRGVEKLLETNYRTTSNLMDISNYLDSFVNYFLTSNSNILEWVVL